MIFWLAVAVVILAGAVWYFHRRANRVPNQYQYEIVLREYTTSSHPDYFWCTWIVNKVPEFGKGRTTLKDGRECSSQSYEDAYKDADFEARQWLKKELERSKKANANKNKGLAQTTSKLTEEEAYTWEPRAHRGRIV